MRFLRMFTNSLLAGGLGAAYLTVLLLQLNPHVPLLSSTTWRWLLTFELTYGLHLGVLLYVLVVGREFFSVAGLSPGWASVRVLAWLSATIAAAAAVLMWLNVNAFPAGLDAAATRRMIAGALATSAVAIVLLAIAIAHYSYGRRGSRVGGALFALAVLGSIALPLAARGPAAPPTSAAPPVNQSAVGAVGGGPRLVMLLLDGASLEYVRTRATEGRLPHFSRLLESGASMYLASVRPTQPAPVWAAVMSGMYPEKSGIRSAGAYFAPGDARAVHLLPDHCFSHVLVRLGIVRSDPYTSAAWRTRPLWSILDAAGLASGIVGLPLTYPAAPTLGFTLAERQPDLPAGASQYDERAAHPPGLLADVRASFVETGNEDLGGSAGSDAPEAAASRRDRLYSRAAWGLRESRPVSLLALRLQALDVAGHRYFDDGDGFPAGRTPDAARRVRAQLMERAYAAVDAEIGRAVASLAPGDLLMVVSGFGMQRLHPAKQVLAWALDDQVTRGTHERAPDGFLIAFGTPVHSGRLPRGSIVDVTPTALYFLGLPVGRDMDGYVRADLFDSAFTAERPIAFIGTHNR